MNSNDTVKSFQKITSGEGGFRTGTLSSNCHFGSSVALLGDLNNDGVPDLAVGAQQDPGRRSGGDRVGAMWVLFMNADGTVKTDMMITSAGEEFSGSLGDRNYFGTSVAPLGDLNGDNRVDMAVGARGDGSGAVWILFMDSGGTVGSHQKIADGGAGFSGTLGSRDVFGSSLAALGDFNNDNVIDLVVGAAGNDDGGLDRGAVWLLFLNSDGTVDSNQKISYTVGGLGVPLTNQDAFGSAVAPLGDLDGDGTLDIAVGSEKFQSSGGQESGAVWLLFLNATGMVKSYLKASDPEVGFAGSTGGFGHFGNSLAAIGPTEGDRFVRLAVGNLNDDDGGDSGGANRGAFWILGPAPEASIALDLGSGRLPQVLEDSEAGQVLFEGAIVTSVGGISATVELLDGQPEDSLFVLGSGSEASVSADGHTVTILELEQQAMQATLRNISMRSIGEPAPGNRSILMNFTSNGQMLLQVITNAIVVAQNDPPMLNISAIASPFEVTEEADPEALFVGIALEDPDSNTVNFTVAVGNAKAGDELSSVDSQVAVSQNGLSVTVAMQSITAAVASLETVRFRTTSENSRDVRAVSVVVSDEHGGTNEVQVLVSVLATNDAHIVSVPNAGPVNVTEGQDAPFAQLFGGTTVTDPENATEYHLRVAIVAPVEGDAIVWDPVGVAGAGIAISNDSFIGQTDVALPIPATAISEVLQGFTFSTGAEFSAELTRIITLTTVTDGWFGEQASMSVETNVTARITPVNQPPAVTTAQSTLTFDEASRESIVIFGDVTLTDVDDVRASAQITMVGSKDGDTLVDLTDGESGVSVSMDGRSATAHVSNLTHLSARLAQVAFNCTARFVDPAPRRFALVITDMGSQEQVAEDGRESTSLELQATVGIAYKAIQLEGPVEPAVYTEGQSNGISVLSGLTATARDTGNNISAVVTLNPSFAGDYLSTVVGSAATVSQDGLAVTIPQSHLDDVLAAVTGITFGSDEGSMIPMDNRSIQVVITDSSPRATVASTQPVQYSRVVVIDPVNDAPSLFISLPMPLHKYVRGTEERILLGSGASIILTDIDDEEMTALAVSVVSGCRESEDELFLVNGAPASVSSQWVGGSADSSSPACTLTLMPSQGDRLSISDCIAAMRAVAFRASNSIEGEEVEVMIRFNVTDAAAKGNSASNGGPMTALNQSVLLTVVPHPEAVAVVNEIDDILGNIDADGEECGTADGSSSLSSITDDQTVLKIDVSVTNTVDGAVGCVESQLVADVLVEEALGDTNTGDESPVLAVVRISRRAVRGRGRRVSLLSSVRARDNTASGARGRVLQEVQGTDANRTDVSVYIPFANTDAAVAAFSRLAIASVDGSLDEAIDAISGLQGLRRAGMEVYLNGESSAVGRADVVLNRTQPEPKETDDQAGSVDEPMPSSEEDEGASTGVIVGMVSAVVVLIAAMAGFLAYRRYSANASKQGEAGATAKAEKDETSPEVLAIEV